MVLLLGLESGFGRGQGELVGLGPGKCIISVKVPTKSPLPPLLLLHLSWRAS